MIHATKPAPAPINSAPGNAPKMRRRIGATNIAKKKTNGSAPNASPSLAPRCESAGGGNGSPSIKPINASTPSFTPPA